MFKILKQVTNAFTNVVTSSLSDFQEISGQYQEKILKCAKYEKIEMVASYKKIGTKWIENLLKKLKILVQESTSNYLRLPRTDFC